MSQVFATYEDGVFKPDEPPDLAENTRVRLSIESLKGATDESRQEQAWASLEQLWKASKFDSHGDRLNRDELHERH